MYPFTMNHSEQDTKTTDSDDAIKSSEAMQGDEALIITVRKLNDLRGAENKTVKYA